jgi:hypothetical protein
MYSKALNNKDMRGGRDIYRRQSPSPPRENVRLPVNYKGTAFNSDGSSRTYVPDQIRVAEEQVVQAEETQKAEQTIIEDPPKSETDNRQSPISDLIKKLSAGMASTKNFPFGHGIGFEELLLIGLLLFISDGDGNSDCDKDDTDLTRLILTALLLCG